jgi:hypothetical protein
MRSLGANVSFNLRDPSVLTNIMVSSFINSANSAKVELDNKKYVGNISEEIRSGEFISFKLNSPLKEIDPTIVNTSSKQNNYNEKKLINRFGIFVKSEPRNKQIHYIELKFYLMNMKDESKKLITQSEGLNFIVNQYIPFMFKTIDGLQYVLDFEKWDILGEGILELKNNFQSYMDINKLLQSKNPIHKHVQGFYRKFNINDIKQLKKVTTIDEIKDEMKNLYVYNINGNKGN